MTWLPETAPGATPLDQVFGLRPDAYARFREMYAGLWDPALIDPALLELCRLRIATILGCDAERAIRYSDARAAGLTEARVAALPRWPNDPAFTEAERRAIEFAEQYVIDPHGLTDEHSAALHREFDESALATLTLAVAMFDALTRMRLAPDVGPVGPEPTVVPGPGSLATSLP
ncbi:MAG: carboxymuconolactone decarboxylase family protein [Acidimicrobiia bacterium]